MTGSLYNINVKGNINIKGIQKPNILIFFSSGTSIIIYLVQQLDHKIKLNYPTIKQG